MGVRVTPADVSGLRVLVAEDNEMNRFYIREVLERAGLAPDFAVTGVEAVEAVAATPYDLVLMDVHMPEMDGLDATRRITRAHDAGDRPRIVALTANALTEDREVCLAAGMDEVLTKPVDLAALSRVLAATPRRGDDEVLSDGTDPAPTTAVDDSRPSATTVLDPQALAVLRSQVGEEATVRMLSSFRERAPLLTAELRDALDAGDVEALVRPAHTMRSMAAFVGAGELSEVCARIDETARVDGAAAMAPLVAQAEQLVAALVVDVDGMLATTG